MAIHNPLTHTALHLRPAGRYTRVATRTENSHVLGETIADFGNEVAGVGSLKKYPCPAACASQRGKPGLLVTRTAITRPKWAREQGLGTE